MCDQQRLRPACAYAQSDQSLCLSLECSISVKLPTDHHLMFLILTGGCTGSSESTNVKNTTKLEITCRGSYMFSLVTSVFIYTREFRSLTEIHVQYINAHLLNTKHLTVHRYGVDMFSYSGVLGSDGKQNTA